MTDVTLFLPPPPDAVLEGGADDALGAPAGEDAALDDGLVGSAGVEAAADGGVLALGVLAEDDHVNVAGLLAGDGGLDAGIEDGGADADGLIEGAAHGQQQALQGDVVGDVGVAHRAEEDGVVGG